MKFFPSYAVNYRGTVLYPGRGYVIDPADAEEMRAHGHIAEEAVTVETPEEDDLGLGEETAAEPVEETKPQPKTRSNRSRK